MNKIFWIFLYLNLLLIGCTPQKEKPSSSGDASILFELPETVVVNSDLQYNHKTSLFTLNHQAYSGYAVSYYPDGRLKEKFGVLHGKKQNQFLQWYADGHLKSVSTYHQGRLHGAKNIWSAAAPHVLIARFNYHTGKAHGAQTKWYPTGELYKKLNLNQGKEEGMQRAYRKNGVLYANYEARKGRIFGLKKAALCYGLEDEKVHYKRR